MREFKIIFKAPITAKINGFKSFLKKNSWPKLKKILLKIRLSILVRNSQAPNEPLNIFFLNFILTQRRPPIETLWCKNNESERLKISHFGTFKRVSEVFRKNKKGVCYHPR
jgi:hypothetical protein